MTQYKPEQKVRILVDIDGFWHTKGLVARVFSGRDRMVRVECLDGCFTPVAGLAGPEPRLWVSPEYLAPLNRGPVSPVFLQEVE